MRRFMVFAGIALAILIILGWAVSLYTTSQEKSFSPEEYVSFDQDGVSITVFYNRPYKKGRDIFGNLVPYDKVWRTGANEATTFESNRELFVKGKRLPAGKYSLWTIPGKEVWTVIFNSQYGQWGINSDGEANRNPAQDVLSVEVPRLQQDGVFEQFTIAFDKVGEEAEMVLFWDHTLIAIPFSYDLSAQ